MSKSTRFKYLLGTVLFLVVSISFIKSSIFVFKSKERLDDIKNEVAKLEDEKRRIEEEIEYKKTQEYIEEKARNDLNLIKPGEKVYVVVSEDGVKESTQSVLSGSSERKEDKRDKNWYSWYKLFF